MEKGYILETLGAIWKEETLATLNHHIIDNTFVLEALEPYPGYHHISPLEMSQRLNHVFLVLKKKLPTEILIRDTQKIKMLYGLKFDAAPAEVTLFNSKYDAIRLRDYSSLDVLPELMAYYRDEGISFMKQRNLQGKGIIRVSKYLLVDQIDAELYRDSEDIHTVYFEIPCQLSWKLFEKVTMAVKQNIADKNFDAALAIIYRKTGIVDLVRIYDEKFSPEKLADIRKRYYAEIARYV